MPSRSSQQPIGVKLAARLRQGCGAAVFASHNAASEDWWASGLEMTIVGVIEAVVTYGLGLAFGAMA
jgi:hypothetical protein